MQRTYFTAGYTIVYVTNKAHLSLIIIIIVLKIIILHKYSYPCLGQLKFSSGAFILLVDSIE